jgi:DNA-binding MarR family transcriptional regulator
VAAPKQDAVDCIIEQWTAVRPDLDSSPIGVIGRVSRLSRLVDRRLATNFAAFGLESWMYDVLATLRRGGEPYELTAGELVRRTMVTTGAITNRVDRLAERGLVERIGTPDDRRKVIVRLTLEGLALVDKVAEAHMATEHQILARLSPRQRTQLANLLRIPLLTLGDDAAAFGHPTPQHGFR